MSVANGLKAVEGLLGLNSYTLSMRGTLAIDADFPVGQDLSRLRDLERRGAVLTIGQKSVDSMRVFSGLTFEQIVVGELSEVAQLDFCRLVNWMRTNLVKTPASYLASNVTAWQVAREFGCALDAIIPAMCISRVASDFLVRSDYAPARLTVGSRDYVVSGPVGFTGRISVTYHFSKGDL